MVFQLQVNTGNRGPLHHPPVLPPAVSTDRRSHVFMSTAAFFCSQTKKQLSVRKKGKVEERKAHERKGQDRNRSLYSRGLNNPTLVSLLFTPFLSIKPHNFLFCYRTKCYTVLNLKIKPIKVV